MVRFVEYGSKERSHKLNIWRFERRLNKLYGEAIACDKIKQSYIIWVKNEKLIFLFVKSCLSKISNICGQNERKYNKKIFMRGYLDHMIADLSPKIHTI